MPDLNLIFSSEDPGFLRLVAEFWGIEDLDADFDELFLRLKDLIDNQENLEEVLEGLPQPAQAALHALVGKGGKMSWADFSHRFGSIREMGAGRRDRLHPYLDPETISETLFYRGLLGKVFLDEKPEPREFAFIPDEILIGIQKPAPERIPMPGQAAKPEKIHHSIFANDSLLQDACTLITALRSGSPVSEIHNLPIIVEERSIRVLLKGCGMLNEQDTVQSGPVKSFLEMPRSAAISKLTDFWKNSNGYDDLFMVAGLIFEKSCPHNPLSIKEQVLEFLMQIPPNTWWDLQSFIEFFHSEHPYFMRPSGDFMSWSIRERDSGQYLQGFESWNQIEGRLLEFLVTKPLHWLGFLDLGFSSQPGGPSSFRLSRWWNELIKNQVPTFPDPAPEDVFINSRGKVTVPVNSSLALRYQIGRFVKLLEKNTHAYTYQLSNYSLKIARKQGLKTKQFIKIIQNHSSSPFPPVLLKALQNWETSGAQAHFDSLKVVRFSNPNIVNTLIHSKAAKYVRESLNPTTLAYDPAGEKIMKLVLLEAGYFSEDEKEKEV